MRTRTVFLLLSSFFIASFSAQDLTTVEASNTDISDNLDLEAVASIFAEAENLEDFEKRLNDPETRISNLDLNEDGYVDYLRVVEKVEGDDDAKLVYAFRRVLTRPPSSEELDVLREFHAKHENWKSLARALLSLDEAITKN